MKPILGVVLCLLSTCGLRAAEPGASTLSTALRSAVDEAVQAEMTAQDLVGVAVGVLRDETIAYLHGYGWANREAQTPVTARTVFNWASNSKPFIAVAAMQLVEQGNLDLEADVRRYVPEFPGKEHVITARQLLCHQSGIPHYRNGRIIPCVDGAPTEPLTELDPVVALCRFALSPLIFTPGDQYEYSSHAYVLLSAVVQRAGNAPIGDQLEARIIRPLGLESFQLDLPYHGQPDWATGYRRTGTGKVMPVEDTAHFWKHGAGGYKSSVADFARWAVALLNHELVGADAEKRLWTAQKRNDGMTTTYGLGFSVSGHGKALKVSHNGGQDETKTRLVLYPGQGHGVVVMSNCTFAEPSKIAAAIEKVLEGASK